MSSVWYKKREFRLIPGDDRFVSIYGDILSFRQYPEGKLLKLVPDTDGYLKVSRPELRVHQSVLAAWLGPRPEGAETRHLDGNKTNNHVSNLAWGDQRENGVDKRRHGNSKGLRNPACKMTEEFVAAIRLEYKHKPLRVIHSENAQYSKFAIWAALSGYTWGHLPGSIPKNRKCFKA